MATILIVDDRSINRECLTTLLAYEGHRLLEAADGLQALSAIEMQADLLYESSRELTAEVRGEFLQGIAAGARRLTLLVNNLLDLAKIEAGRFQLDIAELRVNEVVEHVVRGMGFHATAKRTRLQLLVAPNDPLLRADRLKLSQVVSNLLGNAIKLTPPGGQITVTVRHTDDGVQVSITDTGPGVAAEGLPHIFEKFRQGRAHATAGERSTGLGLAIVRQLVELHGGRIHVDGALDRGSTFTVVLPSAPPALTEPRPAERGG